MTGYISNQVLMAEADYRTERLLDEARQERLARAIGARRPARRRVRRAVVRSWRRLATLATGVGVSSRPTNPRFDHR